MSPRGLRRSLPIAAGLTAATVLAIAAPAACHDDGANGRDADRDGHGGFCS